VHEGHFSLSGTDGVGDGGIIENDMQYTETKQAAANGLRFVNDAHRDVPSLRPISEQLWEKTTKFWRKSCVEFPTIRPGRIELSHSLLDGCGNLSLTGMGKKA
jgi:hypothetical protein